VHSERFSLSALCALGALGAWQRTQRKYIFSRCDDLFASFTEPSVNPSRFPTTLKGMLATSLIMENPATARNTSDAAPASLGSVHMASALIHPLGPSVLVSNLQAKKGRVSGKPRKGQGSGKPATSSSASSAAASSGTRRSARLTARPAQTYVLQFPQITDAEESDEGDGVVYDFRWQDGDL